MTEHDHDDQYEQRVMLDVGPGAGALVIYTAEELNGEEIEISPAGNDAQRVAASLKIVTTVDGDSDGRALQYIG